MKINRLFCDDNVSVACFIVGSGSFVYLYGRETLLMKYYLKLKEMYTNKEPVPVRNILKFKYEAVQNDLNITNFSREYFGLFITKELDPITVGSTKVKQGVKVGVPDYYQHGTTDAIKNSLERICKSEIDWSSKEGEQLLQSLSLSEGAQKFVLAKATLLGDTYYHLINALFAPFFTIGYFICAHKIVSLKKLHARSGLFTLGTYTISAVIFGILYLFCSETLYLQYDKVTFEEALDISQGYINGALEYYQKKMERNKALRNLIPQTANYYDEVGDETGILIAQGIPDSIKYELVLERLRKYDLDKEATTPPPVNPNPHPVI